MILVKLTAALICFANDCYPILYGHDTPTGEFDLVPRVVLKQGYGGDILQFKEDETGVYAIHRIWLGSPKQRRPQRIKDIDPKKHIITNGCINVEPEVYEKLKDCCSRDHLEIVQ